MHNHSNALINESSPYLLQHAHNPVNWLPWGEEAFVKAKKEDKLVLISIGYSSCHWCHVMEHESFEDETVAAIMNERYVCIKVDREERPDIDQIYMNAVQLMTGQGGWPLNCFALPDQRPVYGGTYFPKEDWKSLLLNLDDFFHNKRDEALAYATKLTAGVQQSERIRLTQNEPDFKPKDLTDIVSHWKQLFDFTEGGHARAPKFPLPNNFLFLMQYAHFQQDAEVDNWLNLSLQKMAKGGIYDQLGGGFARYSVDVHWHVPHFEKMLYDNAQLVSLYVNAFQKTGNPLYKQVVYQSLDFVEREMISPEGGFYSALDADSEGVEGKFYCWTKAEIELCNKQATENGIEAKDLEVFCHYFDISEKGNWEGTNILRRLYTDEEVARKFSVSVQQLNDIVSKGKAMLMQYREKRVRPGLDNKILAAWNGMMLKAYAEAYRVFDEERFLTAAVTNAELIADKMISGDNSLQRSYTVNGKHSPAFLDDYAFVASGFIALYQAAFDEKWLLHARKLTKYAVEYFFDNESKMFFYTSQNGERLIGRKHEIMDNVIPSSNSEMARVLHMLGHYFDDENQLSISKQMLGNVLPDMASYGSAYSNWAILLSNHIQGMYEIAITGKNSLKLRQELEKHYIPNKLILGGQSGTLPLLEGKFTDNDRVYVCKNKTCQLPVGNIADALKQVKPASDI